MVGIDYRGSSVLAAYEPIPALGLGLVAKIDMAALRAPFIRAGSVAGVAALFLIAIGGYLFGRVNNAYIRHLEGGVEEARIGLIERTELSETLRSITVAAHETHSFEEAARVCIDKLCAEFGWDVGHLYLVEGSKLLPADIWHLQEPGRFTDFVELTRQTTLQRNIGLPGRAFAARETVYSALVTEDPNFPRAPAALASGIKSGLAAPVLLGQEVVAVVEFYSSEVKAPSAALRSVLDQAGAQLGWVMQRLRLEEHLRQTQKMDAIGGLTGGIAHEFNNLLMVIRGNLEMLETQTGDDESLQVLVARALKGTSRGASLTHRLLAFARKQPLREEVCDLNSLVAGMHKMLGRTLGETIAIKTTLDKQAWATRVDPGEVEDALLNLVINARDAMPTGGEITIATANLTLDEGGAVALGDDVDPGDYVTVSVSDTGCGMSDDVIAHAFEPFFTTKKVGDGTGLGLSMVYGLTKQSKGHVTIESATTNGTTVRLYFPRSEGQEVTPVVAMRTDRLVVGRRRTVLVVEDDTDVRGVVMSMVANLGHEVLAAKDGTEALRVIAQRSDIDLLFSDVVMPGGLMGWQLAQQAKAHHPGLAVLLTTGHDLAGIVTGSEDIRDGTKLLRKPYGEDELHFAIQRVFDDGELAD